MTVESALAALHTSARQLGEAVQDLVLIAVEDRPRGQELHLTTLVHDAALDLAARAEQVTGALRADGSGARMSGATTSRRVAECHAGVNSLGAVLVRELAAPDRMTEPNWGDSRERQKGIKWPPKKSPLRRSFREAPEAPAVGNAMDLSVLTWLGFSGAGADGRLF